MLLVKKGLARININEFMQEVHANAVAHGWWDDPRPQGEVMALIHSEWSEALEEARAGRPMVWYACADQEESHAENCDYMPPNVCKTDGPCAYREKKPEGIGMELADGCIRILDFLAHVESGLNAENNSLEKLCEGIPRTERHLALSECVAMLHWHTSIAYALPTGSVKGKTTEDIVHTRVAHLYMALAVACVWINENGGDAENIMRTKHEYNKGRGYKHGKKF